MEEPSDEAEVIDSGLEGIELSQLRTLYSRTLPAPSSHHSEHRHPWVRFLAAFWSHQVSVVVPHEALRDHLALERTFLAYLRTSSAISILGVVVAQLFRIQHAAHPADFGFFVLGKPLAALCQGAAIYCLFLGACRSWRLQNAMVRGKAITGGFELVLLGGGMSLVSFGP